MRWRWGGRVPAPTHERQAPRARDKRCSFPGVHPRRGAPPRAIHEPKRVGERRANWRCPERRKPTCFEERCLSLAADGLDGLTGAPALFAGGTEASGVTSSVDITAFVFGRHFVLDLLSPGLKVRRMNRRSNRDHMIKPKLEGRPNFPEAVFRSENLRTRALRLGRYHARFR